MPFSKDLGKRTFSCLILTKTERTICYLTVHLNRIWMLMIRSWTSILGSMRTFYQAFIFISCIIALIAFIFLIALCFKHDKLRRFMSFYMASPQTVAASLDKSSCNRGNVFMYLLSAVCLMILLYVILILLFHGYRQFRLYHTTTDFLRRTDMKKDFQLLLPLSSVLCRKSFMFVSHIYKCLSHFCQSMNPTTMNIILC